jgi:hypothetical protein
MKTIQNIHQQLTQMFRAISLWSSSVCGDIIFGFTAYNNEPKQGGTEV